jgi:hypothetical protein
VVLGVREVAGHLPAFRGIAGGAELLVDELLEVAAAPEHRGRAAVVRQDQVVGVERRGRADDRGLLAGEADVEADAPLALQHHEALLEFPVEDHLGVEPGQEFIGKVELLEEVGAEHLAVGGDDLEQPQGGVPFHVEQGLFRGRFGHGRKPRGDRFEPARVNASPGTKYCPPSREIRKPRFREGVQPLRGP